ncbi:hypothetical protein MMC07_006921 [Pseudocyphellaria aurata]|nr:hypothetical protein [Pseudocyphellaria aurata]
MSASPNWKEILLPVEKRIKAICEEESDALSAIRMFASGWKGTSGIAESNSMPTATSSQVTLAPTKAWTRMSSTPSIALRG